MTVWAMHPVKDDLSAALPYGELRFITKGYVHGDELEKVGDVEWLPRPALDKLRDAAREFSPTTDWLLIVGDHLQLVQFVALLSQNYSEFGVLRYDRQAEGYLAVEIVTVF